MIAKGLKNVAILVKLNVNFYISDLKLLHLTTVQ